MSPGLFFRRARLHYALSVGLALALAGCGRRGDLEPPSANAVQNPQAQSQNSFHRPSKTITPPQKDFVLDPLLQ